MRCSYPREILFMGVILVFSLSGCSLFCSNEPVKPRVDPTPSPPSPPPMTLAECIKAIPPEASPATRRAEEMKCEKNLR